MERGKGREKKVENYGNFWLIWLSCASKPKSLFQIQFEWGISTNYLYHRERGLKKRISEIMLQENYIERKGKNLIAKFDWVPTYLSRQLPEIVIKKYGRKFLTFLVNNRQAIFDLGNLKILFKNDPSLLKKYGRHLFSYIFLFMFLADFSKLSQKYRAEHIPKVFKFMLKFSTEVNLVKYFERLEERIKREDFFLVEKLEEWLELVEILS